MRARAAIFVFSFSVCVLRAQNASDAITGEQRINWVVMNTIGPVSLIGGAVSSGWGTLLDNPHEYGTHWDGFGKRYGMRLTGVATSNIFEAGLGAVWGEDPRYHRAEGQPFGARVRNVVKFTFLARNDYGEIVPAYARYAGIAGSSFLSNAWRPNSQADEGHALARIGLGFLGRMSSNAFLEFWPDVRDRVFHGRGDHR